MTDKVESDLTLSVGSPQLWITGLEHEPSIIEHMHSIRPSTRGAAGVKLFHNVPHLDHTAISGDGCLVVTPTYQDVAVNLFNFLNVSLRDKTFLYRFLCETELVVEYVDTLVNCN